MLHLSFLVNLLHLKVTIFFFIKYRLNRKFRKSIGIEVVWSDNIYRKWSGLARQHREKYVHHHDYFPFIAQPPGRALIRTAKEDKSIHFNWEWWLQLAQRSRWNNFEKGSFLFSLFKQKFLSEMDRKYILAAKSVVIVKAEFFYIFCRLCHRNTRQSLKYRYQSIQGNAGPHLART